MLCCSRVTPSAVGVAYQLGAFCAVDCNYVALQVMLKPIYLPGEGSRGQIAHTEHTARGIVEIYGYIAGGFLGYYSVAFEVVGGTSVFIDF